MFRFDRRLLQSFDWVMLVAVIIIALLGLLNLYSAASLHKGFGTSVFVKQIYYYLLGFCVILTILMVDYKVLTKWSYPFYIMTIFLLLAALFFGTEVAGTQRWINLGFFRLQPSEPAKLMLVITLASYYYRKDTGAGFAFKELIIPMGLTILPFALIVKQPDLGTAMMMIIVFVSMTLFVKLKWSTLVTLAGVALSFVPLVWLFYLKPYQRQRILTFINPESDPLGSGYHIAQSKIAVGSGATFGKGYMQGTQAQLDFLPERHTDFAFSVWAEEWGFVGSLFFLACYFFIILWGLNIALTARDKFGVLLAFGIVSLLFWQAFVNLGMVLGLLPVVGMPLPLFSYGGSSLLTTLAAIGILMNIRMRRFMTSG
ncbi:rod shape-determining protein RodA [Desulfurivibrio dismutans]|uniref:rod shape-determining protein RodA n=1 Tax=Desulfurivibrio dismutans TaxID=1398908 RepID=UPI0023D9D803|nr:rod shape-determining protein RodA [Desulfurivibrio alkaliphilus]MDF1614008.1 rod shape-determining protein RodA [Desulfurivibrio alkaliphilus]